MSHTPQLEFKLPGVDPPYTALAGVAPAEDPNSWEPRTLRRNIPGFARSSPGEAADERITAMLFAPYHAVVRANLRKSFADISGGRGATVAAQFAPDATLQFYGDHALGGELHGRAAIAAWFARLHRFFPGLRVTPLQIVVNGTPWNTTVATRFSVTASLPGGEPYRNEGMQYVRISWARIVEDRIYEDTDRLKDALRTIGSAGAPDAVAASLG